MVVTLDESLPDVQQVAAQAAAPAELEVLVRGCLAPYSRTRFPDPPKHSHRHVPNLVPLRTERGIGVCLAL